MGSVWFPRWLWLLYRDTDLKDWTDLWDGDLVLGIPFELVIMSTLDGSIDVDALLLLMKLSLPVKFCLWLTPFVLDRTCSECWYECKPDNADLKYIEWLEIRKNFKYRIHRSEVLGYIIIHFEILVLTFFAYWITLELCDIWTSQGRRQPKRVLGCEISETVKNKYFLKPTK